MEKTDDGIKARNHWKFVAVPAILIAFMLAGAAYNLNAKADSAIATMAAQSQDRIIGYTAPFNAEGKTYDDLLKIVEGQRGRAFENGLFRQGECDHLLGQKAMWTDSTQSFKDGVFKAIVQCGISLHEYKTYEFTMPIGGDLLIVEIPNDRAAI
jgi:hypothetical protein